MINALSAGISGKKKPGGPAEVLHSRCGDSLTTPWNNSKKQRIKN